MVTFKWSSRKSFWEGWEDSYTLSLNVRFDDGEKCGANLEVTREGLKNRRIVLNAKNMLMFDLAKLISDKYEGRD